MSVILLVDTMNPMLRFLKKLFKCVRVCSTTILSRKTNDAVRENFTKISDTMIS